ncbi:MAG: hypothetical protein ACPIOQ_19025 [Promethearchaeia archaeon]
MILLLLVVPSTKAPSLQAVSKPPRTSEHARFVVGLVGGPAPSRVRGPNTLPVIPTVSTRALFQSGEDRLATFRVSNLNDIGSREKKLSELQSAIDQRSRRLWTWQQRA